MSYYIGERFLSDTKQGHLDRSRQRRQIVWRFQADVDGLVAQVTVLQDLLVQRGKQPQFVKRWRAQGVHQAPHIRYRLLRACNQLGEQCIGQRVMRQSIAGRLQLQGQTGEPWPQAIV
jgi:hypothetical protein